MAEAALRSRLERFYTKYNPEKLSTIPEIVKEYLGNEEKLFQILSKRYGPEPTAADLTPAAPVASAEAPVLNDGNDALRRRLYRFYNKYNPSKTSDIEKVIAQFKDKPDHVLFSQLVSKYGPEPTDEASSPSSNAKSKAPSMNTSTYEDRLTRYFQKYVPSKLDQVASMLEKYKGREEEYISALVGKYGPEPAATAAPSEAAAKPVPSTAVTNSGSTTPSSSSFEARLTRYFQKYVPSKLDQVTPLLEKYKGREEEYISALVGKYGPEPAGTAAPSEAAAKPVPSTSVTSPAGPAPKVASFEERLTRYFQKYVPSKLDQVTPLLEKYKGREEEYISALVGKYGPEPAATAAPSEAAAKPVPSTPVTSPAGTTPPSSYEDRLTRYFQKYVPGKLDQVASMLEKYKGREEEYISALVGKYGPEPASSSASSVAASSEPATPARRTSVAPLSYEERLARYFQKYAPNKLDQVASMLEKYKGREEEYISALVGKYGPEPTSDAAVTTPASTPAVASPAGPAPKVASFEERLTRYFQKYVPNKVGQVAAMVEKYKGQEEEYISALVGKYGPEPTPQDSTPTTLSTVASPTAASSNAFRDRLVRFYEKYQPDKISGIDTVLTKYSGKEDDLFAALVKKYGPEPQDEAMSRQEVPDDDGSSYRSRVERIYRHYQPEKVAQVSQMLEKYKDKEMQLIEALVKKYGPEPVDSSAKQDPAPEAVEQIEPASPSSPGRVCAPPSTPQHAAQVRDLLEDLPQDEREQLRAVSRAHGIEITVATQDALTLLRALAIASVAPARQTIEDQMNSVSNASPARKKLNEPAYSPGEKGVVEVDQWSAQAKQRQRQIDLELVALVALESDMRIGISETDDDERMILAASESRERKKILLRIQLERVVNGSEAAIRAKMFHAWQLYAKARQHHRRQCQSKEMPAYLRMQMTPLAKKYYENIRREEERALERIQRKKSLEAQERLERVQRQRAAMEKSGNIVEFNKSLVASQGAPGSSIRNQKSPSRRCNSPQRYGIRPISPRERSPRHSTTVVYVDARTGLPPPLPASLGKPSLANIVALRGGPSPSSRVDFLDREKRLAFIQQQFDLLPPTQKARVFRQLKKWDMVPVLGHQHDTRRSGAGSDMASQQRLFFSAKASTKGNSTNQRRVTIDETMHSLGEFQNRGEENGSSVNDSRDALDYERMRMESSRADKLFSSPFMCDDDAPALCSPVAASYVHDGDETQAQRRLAFNSAIKGEPHTYDDDEGDFDEEDNEDMHAFMELALREALEKTPIKVAK